MLREIGGGKKLRSDDDDFANLHKSLYIFQFIFQSQARRSRLCVSFKVRTSINLLESPSDFYFRFDADVYATAITSIYIHFVGSAGQRDRLMAATCTQLLIVIEFVFVFHESATETNQLKRHSDT